MPRDWSFRANWNRDKRYGLASNAALSIQLTCPADAAIAPDQIFLDILGGEVGKEFAPVPGILRVVAGWVSPDPAGTLEVSEVSVLAP